jgi:hypothetical protein
LDLQALGSFARATHNIPNNARGRNSVNLDSDDRDAGARKQSKSQAMHSAVLDFSSSHYHANADIDTCGHMYQRAAIAVNRAA